jgi:methionine synthase II (cobalamin-independent)
MAAPRNPPFRAEHLGSLLRPADLLQKRAEFEAQKISYDELKPVEDAAVKKIVEVQESLGIHSITDGEYRYV